MGWPQTRDWETIELAEILVIFPLSSLPKLAMASPITLSFFPLQFVTAAVESFACLAWSGHP